MQSSVEAELNAPRQDALGCCGITHEKVQATIEGANRAADQLHVPAPPSVQELLDTAAEAARLASPEVPVLPVTFLEAEEPTPHQQLETLAANWADELADAYRVARHLRTRRLESLSITGSRTG